MIGRSRWLPAPVSPARHARVRCARLGQTRRHDTRTRGALAFRTLLIGVALLAAGGGSQAAEPRPRMAVTFRLAERNYRLQYTSEERHAIEDSLAEDACRILGDRIGVFEFAREGATDSLHVVLGDSTAHGLAPVLFALTAAGADVLPIDLPVTWEFLTADQAQLPPGEPEAFRAEAAGAFALRVAERSDELVARLLSKVVLTRTLERNERGPEYWVLPFRTADLRVGLKSRFELRQFLRDEDAVLEREYESQVTGFATPEKLVLVMVLNKDDLLGEAGLRPEAVRLLEYRRPDPTSGGPLPLEP